MADAEATLRFLPLCGALDVSFLTELARRKLHEFRLSDEPVDIRGSYSRASHAEVRAVRLDVPANVASSPPSRRVCAGGLSSLCWR